MNNLILVDADGVLLDWYPSFLRWAEARGYTEIETGNPSAMERVYERLSIPEDEARGLIKQFNSSAAIGFLGPFFDAIKSVKHLHQEYGMMFHVVSAMGSDIHAQKLRTMNLERLYGESLFDGFTYVDTYGDKSKVLERWKGSGCFFVEDSPHQLKSCSELGLKPALLAHAYNKYAEALYPRYISWRHFVSHNFGSTP